jgi:soluble lytic murein transglycosylase
LTVARAKSWDDVGLRFPIDYADEIKKNATLQGLDTPIIYGLVRRESMFDKLAHSPAGALGLMQIMPRTGRQIAKEMKLRWRSKSALLDAELNLKFGAYYYKQMLTKYEGNFALAAAAYNAGPHRVDRWIKTESGYPADIWVETIPYKETRGYVAAVLTYALVYQHRMGENKLTMQDFMLNIKPQSITTEAVAAGNIRRDNYPAK